MKNKQLLFLILAFLGVFHYGCEEDTIDESEIGNITGSVVNKEDKSPIANAKISTNPATSTVFTDDFGQFILEGVSVGEYSVQAKKEGLTANFEGVTVQANSSVNVIFEMENEAVLNTPPKAPVPLLPQDNQVDVSNNFEFVWGKSTDREDQESLAYTLEIRDAQNQEMLRFENITDTIKQVDNLQFSKQYFWQVSVSDGVNDAVRSELFTFKTADFPVITNYFVKNVNGNNVIYALSEDEDEIQLTSENYNSFRPRKNNGVNKIAFMRSVGAQTHLFTMNPDGSDQQQISSIPIGGFNMEMVDFDWTSNGNALVYPNFTNLFQVNYTGGGTQAIYQTSDGSLITEVAVYENDNSKIALITNDNSGYNAKVFVYDLTTNVVTHMIQQNLPGAVGGIDFSPAGNRVLFTRDVQGFESPNYRQLDSRIFLYNLNTQVLVDISSEKDAGTNDLDPKFSPTGADIIFVNVPNNLNATPQIYISDINPNDNEPRFLLVDGAYMPEWK